MPSSVPHAVGFQKEAPIRIEEPSNTSDVQNVPQDIQGIHPPRLQTASKSVRFQIPEDVLESAVQFVDPASTQERQMPINQSEVKSPNVSLIDQQKPETIIPKPQLPGAKLAMDSCRRKKAHKNLGDEEKEVIFGQFECNSVVAGFGDLSSTKEFPWGQTLTALTLVHFTKMCLAQDFKVQFGSGQYQTLWHGSLASSSTDEAASKAIDGASEHLRLCSAGLVAVCPQFVILVYPAIEVWKFIEGPTRFSLDTRLRYLVFQGSVDFW